MTITQDREVAASEYGANSIKSLQGLLPVFMRPGMYVGSTGPAGCHHLIWEVVDNSVDEAMGGFADRIDVVINADDSISVTDNGRGIPVEPQTSGDYKGMPTVEMVLTVLHAGGKFGDGAYSFSGGLHGVGISVVNALSDWVDVEVRRNGQIHEIGFAFHEGDGTENDPPVPGKVVSPLRSYGRIPKAETGTKVTFLPNASVFSSTEWDSTLIKRRLRQGAFLNPGLTFTFRDDRTDGAETFTYCYPGGLVDFMAEQAEKRLADSEHQGKTDLLMPLEPLVMGAESPRHNGSWQMVMRWYPDTYYRVSSFANGIETHHGGAHVKGYEQVLTMLMNRYARQDHVELLSPKEPNMEAIDVRSGLGVIIAVKVKEPQFVGQTKDELSNDEVRQMVREGFSEQFWAWMENHPTEAAVIIEKAANSMRLRHKMADIEKSERSKQEKRGTSPKATRLPDKLSDCSTRDRSEAELFIVEGNSAAGPAIKARNARMQAILPIRGKGLNIEAALQRRDGLAQIEANKEMQGLVAAIGAGSWDMFDPSQMRYGKIIICTDADDDGAHISLLLLSAFYRLMPGLIENGHLYISRPPLFSVTDKKGKKRYFANEDERDEFASEPGNGNLVYLRFKGLSEMNPSQLGETAINPDTRKIDRVTIEDASVAEETITSLMGGDAGPKWEALQDYVVEDMLE